MWAMARTFTEEARCLEQSKPKPTPKPQPKPVVVPIAVKPAPAAVVKTLKDPPEIWDLVREAPREGFKARSAFVSRIKSMNRVFAFGAFAALLLMVACGVLALVLRSSQARNVAAEVPPVQTTADTTVSPPVSVEVSTPAAPPSETVKKAPITRQTRRYPVAQENMLATAPSSEVSPVPAEVAPPVIEKPKPDAAVKRTPNTPVSPHLITPAKSAPPKGKVIQWP